MNGESDNDILMAFLNDELADDEVRSLTRRLHDEPELADQLLLMSREESVISEWARSMPAQVDGDEANPMRIASWVKSAMAMAAVLALAALIMFAMQDDPSKKKPDDVAVEPKPQGAIARVVKVFEPRSEDGLRELTTGDWLLPGDLKLTAGAAEIEFDRGAKVIMEALCHLELKSADRVVLRFGKVAADVPSTAIGFTIDTADLEIIDHGTRFGVAVTRSNEVEIHVFEGHVEAREHSDSQSRPKTKHLLAGDAIRSVGNDESIETLRLAPQRFVRELPGAMTQRGSLYWLGFRGVVGGRIGGTQFSQLWQGNVGVLRGLAFDARSGDILVADSISDAATEPGKILRVSADGVSEKIIDTGAGIFNLLLIGDRLYWPERATGRIMSCNRDGSDLTVLISDVGHPSGLALDISAGHVYWTDWDEGAIWRSDLDGGSFTRLIDGITNPKSLTIDTVRQRMYWVDGEHKKGPITLKRADLNGQRPADLVVAKAIGAIAIAPQRGTIYIGGLDNRVVRFDEDRWDGQTTSAKDLIAQETITPIFTTPGSHRVIYVPEH